MKAFYDIISIKKSNKGVTKLTSNNNTTTKESTFDSIVNFETNKISNLNVDELH